jgi:hypothetical protein
MGGSGIGLSCNAGAWWSSNLDAMEVYINIELESTITSTCKSLPAA